MKQSSCLSVRHESHRLFSRVPIEGIEEMIFQTQSSPFKRPLESARQGTELSVLPADLSTLTHPHTHRLTTWTDGRSSTSSGCASDDDVVDEDEDEEADDVHAIDALLLLLIRIQDLIPSTVRWRRERDSSAAAHKSTSSTHTQSHKEHGLNSGTRAETEKMLWMLDSLLQEMRFCVLSFFPEEERHKEPDSKINPAPAPSSSDIPPVSVCLTKDGTLVIGVTGSGGDSKETPTHRETVDSSSSGREDDASTRGLHAHPERIPLLLRTPVTLSTPSPPPCVLCVWGNERNIFGERKHVVPVDDERRPA